ncbi:MAG: hypothetical protein HOY75_08275 [Streptomyces sp.]|nr:hypothetical protein [Streptomyces sp.]
MSILTIAPAATEPADGSSYNDGYTDGELAAITGLSSRRVHARAAMADQYDVLYAQGLIDGFLHAIQVNASLTEKARASS